MIIYNVTTQIDPAVHDEWMRWMKSHHIPAIMKTGCFTEYRMLKVLGEEAGGHTYSIQYTCETMNDYNEYNQRYAPALRNEYNEKYKDKFVNFRTLLEVIE